jgi:hypothetical protein
MLTLGLSDAKCALKWTVLLMSIQAGPLAMFNFPAFAPVSNNIGFASGRNGRGFQGFAPVNNNNYFAAAIDKSARGWSDA